MKPNYPERTILAHLPTAIDKMDRLSDYLGGPRLLIKRDDQTGLALGGNKTRKLEFLAADALANGCDRLITTGAAQSNHCRQTAAAAARLGLDCTLVLRGTAPVAFDGNLLLDRLLDADLVWAGDRPRTEVMEEVAAEVAARGGRPYMIPLGGSNPVGACGYVLAMEELAGQLADQQLAVDTIVVASSSGGTQAGMLVGARASGFTGRILGISIDHPAEELRRTVSQLATQTAEALGLGQHDFADAVEVNDGYLGGGYGVMGSSEREAIRLTAELEGILLDPVYTGRAMGGFIDLIRQGAFSQEESVLFWHTGGTPALFAYDDRLSIDSK